MNADNFAEFLSDKSNLYKLSYEELKTLSLQYPYSSNIQLLLTLKSKMEQHKDFEKNLARAATLCPDRKHLLLRLQAVEVDALQPENLILKEDYLELKDLSALSELDKIPVEPTVESAQNGQHDIPDSISSQLQHESAQEDPTNYNPFLNSSGKDYEDINLSETLLKDLLDDDIPSEIEPETEEIESETTTPVESSVESEPLPQVHLQPGEEQTPIIPDEIPEPESEFQAPLEQQHEEPQISQEPQPEPQPQPESQPQSKPEPQPEPEPLLPPLPSYQVPESLILNLVAASKITEWKALAIQPAVEVQADIAEKPSNAEGMPKPSPKSSFTSWVQQFQPEHTKLRLAELMEARKLEELKRKKKLKVKKKRKKKKKSNVIVIAEKSITENSEIATETLADLLTQQEQYEKATQVYHRLIEMYPEKKAYYQTKIFDINNQTNRH